MNLIQHGLYLGRLVLDLQSAGIGDGTLAVRWRTSIRQVYNEGSIDVCIASKEGWTGGEILRDEV